MVSTGYVKKRTGITERTIRYYSHLKLITPCKNKLGQLNLSEEDLLELLRALVSRTLGVKLNSIRENDLSIEKITFQLQRMYTSLEFLLVSLSKLESENDILNALRESYELNEKYINKR